jgi:hypothetical protein
MVVLAKKYLGAKKPGKEAKRCSRYVLQNTSHNTKKGLLGHLQGIVCFQVWDKRWLGHSLRGSPFWAKIKENHTSVLVLPYPGHEFHEAVFLLLIFSTLRKNFSCTFISMKLFSRF